MQTPVSHPATTAARILIVSGSLVAQRLVASLELAGFAVSTANNVDGRIDGGGVADCHLAVMDFTSTGCAALVVLRASGSHLPVLVLTDADDARTPCIALDAGADGFLAAPFTTPELVARIRAILRRSERPQSPTIEVGELSIDLSGRIASVAGQPLKLTVSQFALLEFLARRRGRVVTRRLIIDQLYSGTNVPASIPIDVFVHGIRKQLRLAHSRTVVETVRCVGFSLVAYGVRPTVEVPV